MQELGQIVLNNPVLAVLLFVVARLLDYAIVLPAYRWLRKRCRRK